MTNQSSNNVRFATLVGLLVATSLPLSAQGFDPLYSAPNSLRLEDAAWPDGFGSGANALDAVQVGILTVGGTLDAIVKNGSSLVRMPDVSNQTAVVTVTVDSLPLDNVTAFCLIPDANQRSLLAASSDSGIQILVNASAGDFTEVVSLSAITGWTDCRQLIAEDYDGDGLTDLFGLSSDGLTVRVLRQTAVGVWVAGVSYYPTEAATDFTPIAWNEPTTNLPLEIAFKSLHGVAVMDEWNLTALHTRMSPFESTGDIDRIKMLGGGPDLLAWVFHIDSLSLSRLMVIQEGVTQSEVLAQGIPARVTSGDFSGDASDDLVITFDDGFKVLSVENTSSYPYFDVTTPTRWLLPTLESVGQYQGNPLPGVLADMTGDGLVDYVAPCPGRESITTLYGPLIGTAALSGSFGVDEGSSSVCYRLSPVARGYLEVTYTANYPEANVAGYNAWRLVVWNQPTNTSPTTALAVCSSTVPNTYTATNTSNPHEQTITFFLPPLASWNPKTASEDDLFTGWANDARVFHMAAVPINTADSPVAPTSVGPRASHPLLTSFSFDASAVPDFPMVDDWNTGDFYYTLNSCGYTPLNGGASPLGGLNNVKNLYATVPGEVPVSGGFCNPDLHPQI